MNLPQILNTLWRSFTGANILPHARTSGIILIVGNPPWTQAQRGVEFNEQGISIRRIQVRYFPEVNDRLPDNAGQTIARAMADKFSREIQVEGEITGSNGVMAFALAASIEFANDTADFGDGSGIILMDEATVTQNRQGWKDLSMRASSNPKL